MLSPVGFVTFALGTLVVTVGCVARAVSLRHQPALRRIVVALTGPPQRPVGGSRGHLVIGVAGQRQVKT